MRGTVAVRSSAKLCTDFRGQGASDAATRTSLRNVGGAQRTAAPDSAISAADDLRVVQPRLRRPHISRWVAIILYARWHCSSDIGTRALGRVIGIWMNRK